MNQYISIIPLRAGSRGLVSKNTFPLNNKPLYMYSVEQALLTTSQIYISTDIQSIIDTDLSPNITVLRRKHHLASDQIPMHDVLLDIFKDLDLKETIVVLLQATSPLRNVQDIKNAIQMYETNKYSMVMSVKEEDSKILKYGFLEDDSYKPIHNIASVFMNRQDLPKIYTPNGAIYIFSVKDFLINSFYPTEKIGAYLMPSIRSIDIDNLEDMKIASKLLMNLKK